MDPQLVAMLERAAALRRAGRVDEAIEAYARLLAVEPALPDSWYNLGWLQKQARRFDAALESYGKALEHQVDKPEEVHLNRAVILSDHLGRPNEARAELEAALGRNPGFVPALLNLGNLNEDLGERDEAAAAYRRVLEADPDNALALSRLAGVAPDEDSRALVRRLEVAIAAAPSAAQRADLGFALGRLLDTKGEYSRAFSAYSAANQSNRESFGPKYPGYDPAVHERAIERIIAAFPEPSTSEAKNSAPAIFICGLFRSGSTLTEQILASHSKIVSAGELDIIPALIARIADYPEAVATENAENLENWRSFYREGLAPFTRNGAAVTDKRPDNFLHIGLIKTLFPDAKIVHTIRNRLDNLLSLYFLHLGPAMPYALDLADLAHWHGLYERLMAHWKRLYPDDIFEVDYDTLVIEPEPVLNPLLEFLGLDWEDSLLEFHRRQGPVKTASVWQVREPLHARSSGRWRNYENQLSRALGGALRED